MLAILRRELSSYFTSALGFIYLAVFFFASGFFLFAITLASRITDITPVFSSMFTVLMFIIPILTMRLMSEDKKLKTDQILLTSPVSITGIVAGKFLAAFIVFGLGVAITLVYAVVLSGFGEMEWAVIFGNILGMLLLGGALISIGQFASALTENQLVAAVTGFAMMLAFMMIDAIGSVVPVPFLAKALSSVSFMARYQDFTYGLFNIANVLYFISVMVIFNFLTIRIVEKRRWAS